MKAMILPLLLAAALLAVPGCRQAGEEENHAEAGHAGEGEAHGAEGEAAGHVHEEGEPHLELGSVRGVRFAQVEAPREEGAWFAAESVHDPSAAVALAAPVSGVVTAFSARPGETVRAGAPLVEIRSPELARATAGWLGAGVRLKRAERELARERRLLAAAATSEREVESAEAEVAIARAEEQAARLEIEARGATPGQKGAKVVVRAERAGIVEGFAVALGQGVEVGQALGRLVAPGAHTVRVELPLPGPESWAVGARTEVRQGEGRRWPATVVGVPPALSAETRRLTFFLRLEGADLPFAGTPLEARVPLARAIVLPQTALQQIEGVWGVFVREGEEARFRRVRKGSELGGDVMVLDGLAEGETVAVDGAYLLKSLYLKLAGGGEAHDH